MKHNMNGIVHLCGYYRASIEFQFLIRGRDICKAHTFVWYMMDIS